MSGPVTADGGAVAGPAAEPTPPCVELTDSRESQVGEFRVRRALPRRGRRTVGAWCFLDHMGPATVGEGGLGVAPHPHIGLQTVTWLLEGEALHRDSLGTEQPIRPGQLNLMTAGDGVAHAEEQITRDGVVHGVQLWVALPDTTRRGAAAFEHHAELPRLVLGDATATVLVGELGGHRSPARADTPLVGAELDLRRGTVAVPLDPAFEHALVVVEGAVGVGDAHVRPGALAYLGTGRDELVLVAAAPARVLLLGGEPFPEPVLMAWNFVGRTRDELAQAARDWNAGHERFGTVDSPLARIPAPELPF